MSGPLAAIPDSGATDEPSRAPAASGGRPPRWASWMVFGLTLAGLLWWFPWFRYIPNPNESTRVYLTRAIVDHHTFDIGQPIADYGIIWDHAVRDGRKYCDKAPGLSFLFVPVYAAARWLYGEPPPPLWTFWLARAAVVALPSALFTLALFNFLIQALGATWRVAMAVALLYAFGTLAHTFGALFFSHQALAVCLGGAAIAAHAHRQTGRIAPLLMAGFLIGLAPVVEYPGAVGGILAGVYLLATMPRRAALPLGILAGLPPTALMLWYHHRAFGGPLTTGYSFLQGSFAKVHESGLMGIGVPKPEAIMGLLFAPHRGLFAFAPALLLAVGGFYVWWRSRRARPEFAIAVAICGATFYMASAFGYWQGGDTIGPRHLTPMMPFFAMALAMIWPWAARQPAWARTIFLGAIAYGVWMAGFSHAVYPYYPALFHNPLREITLEFLSRGFWAYNPFGLMLRDGALAGLAGAMGYAALAALAIAAAGLALFPVPRRPWSLAAAAFAAAGMAALVFFTPARNARAVLIERSGLMASFEPQPRATTHHAAYLRDPDGKYAFRRARIGAARFKNAYALSRYRAALGAHVPPGAAEHD